MQNNVRRTNMFFSASKRNRLLWSCGKQPMNPKPRSNYIMHAMQVTRAARTSTYVQLLDHQLTTVGLRCCNNARCKRSAHMLNVCERCVEKKNAAPLIIMLALEVVHDLHCNQSAEPRERTMAKCMRMQAIYMSSGRTMIAR